MRSSSLYITESYFWAPFHLLLNRFATCQTWSNSVVRDTLSCRVSALAEPAGAQIGIGSAAPPHVSSPPYLPHHLVTALLLASAVVAHHAAHPDHLPALPSSQHSVSCQFLACYDYYFPRSSPHRVTTAFLVLYSTIFNSSLPAICASNTSHILPQGPIAIFVSGTSGIACCGMVETFACHPKAIHILSACTHTC